MDHGGADVNHNKFTIDEWINPLICAGQKQMHDIILLLIQYDADVNLYNGLSGDSILHVYARDGYVDGAKILIENGADKNATNNDGLTPKDAAIVNNKDHSHL